MRIESSKTLKGSDLTLGDLRNFVNSLSRIIEEATVSLDYGELDVNWDEIPA